MTTVTGQVAAAVPVSVIALVIKDLSRKSVSEQANLRAQIEALLKTALQLVPAASRIVLDTPHGYVVTLLDAHRTALGLAEQVQSGAAELPLCIGINYGPVAVVDDNNRGHALIGDGITAAMTMAQAAAPGRIIASGPYREALQAEAPDSASRLSAAGRHTDAQVRTHEIFTLSQAAVRSRRWRLAMLGVAACAGILALGAVARIALHGAILPPPDPAIITLNIVPHGEIYVNDVLQGSSPPLTQLEVAPGPHTIEIRNSPFPPVQFSINPVAAEQVTITHTFISKSSPKSSPRSSPRSGDKSLRENVEDVRDNVREGWRDLRRGLGF